MRVFVGVAGLLAAGCFSKPGFHGGADATPGDANGADANGDGGADAPPCTAGFDAPVAITVTNGLVTGEPTISGDLLDLYWAHQTGGSTWVIEQAHRSSTAAEWAAGTAINFGQGTVTDPDPSVTSDGALMFFRLNSGGVPNLMQATRTGVTWGTPSNVPGLESIRPSAIDLSGDGLTVYYTDGSNNLFVATRPNRSVGFGTPVGPFGSGFSFPAVSTDGLELYYSDTASGTSRATRASLMDGFTSTGPVFDGFKDPDLTQDGLNLVLAKDQKVWIANRQCP